ncbi:hypothetical protein F511_25325 [Dorcoceras hygrometricum]|uniref:Uncharacterized protein n=1 Tax=Dorcoceras hygrometricum TaxID=472368 RepID=A0A2Z7BJN7_9LAMI|nr:hypothetical protein F511_25325 [Dorcoceras hygrometricum]
MEWLSVQWMECLWKFLNNCLQRRLSFQWRGLTDLLEIPKDLVFDAKSIVSFSGEPVNISRKKKEMKLEFRLLCDILAKTISVKAGSFDAITQEKFLMMAAIIYGVRINWSRIFFNILKDMVTPGTRQAKGYAILISLLLENVSNLELGESSEFPPSKILTEKTVHRYIVLNDKVGMEEVADASRVKKTPVKRAVSKKRLPAAEAEPVVKKKRTTKSKSVSLKDTLDILPVAHEAVPLHMVAPTPAAPAEQPPMPNKNSQKRKRSIVGAEAVEVVEPVVESVKKQQAETAVDSVYVETVVESVDEPVSLPAVADVINEGISTADDVDIIIEQVIAETAQIQTDEGDQDVDTSDVGERVDEFITETVEEMEAEAIELSADESISLEDIFMTIPVESPLPSAGMEITRITLGKSISIPGVNEGDWYKAGLPKIPETDKGKAPLQERDPVKGNPVKEQILLILADIECLVQLREQVIDEVDKFFNSFSLKRLATLKIDESYFDKEALILSWAETDSTRVALNRRTYILTKYRELLIRKFFEARKINFVPGEGSSATDLLDKLSDIHLFVVEELKEQTMAHGLKWEKTCCSQIFEGRPRDRGAILARTNTNTRSSCWIRTMICVDGVLVIEPCADHWVTIPREVVNKEILPQISYVDTLPPFNDFYRVMRKRWTDVSLEVQEFFASDRLLPVGSLNFCRSLIVVEPVPNFVVRRQTIVSRRLFQLCTAFAQYNLFGALNTVDISSFLSVVVQDRPAATSFVSVSQHVQSVASSDFVDQHVQLFLDQRPHSPSTTTNSSMHFSEDIHLGDDATSNQFSLPNVSTNFSASFDDLRASTQLISNQKKDTRRIDDDQNDVLSKLNTLEKAILAALDQHTVANRNMIHGARQEARTQSNVLSIHLNEFRKGFQGHSAFVTSDLAAMRQEKKAQKAMLASLDEQVAATRYDLLDFRAKAQETLNIITDQLSELVAYINRGGNEKNGEESSSQRPQPPPDDQNRPGGGSKSCSRGDRSGSSKRRHYSSGGGPFRRSFEDWLGYLKTG